MAAITGAAGAFLGPARDQNGLIKDPIEFTEEPMLDFGDHQTYVVQDPQKRYLDKLEPVIVEVSIDGAPWEPITHGFVIQHAGGVVFFSEPDPTRQVRVSGYYFELEEKLGFFSWSLNFETNILQTSDFQSDGWMFGVDGNRSWTAQAEQYWRVSEDLADWAGNLLPISFYVDSRPGREIRYEGVGYVNQDVINTPQGDLVSRTLSFTGDGPVWPRTAMIAAWDENNVVDRDRVLDAGGTVPAGGTNNEWLTRLFDAPPKLQPAF